MTGGSTVIGLPELRAEPDALREAAVEEAAGLYERKGNLAAIALISG